MKHLDITVTDTTGTRALRPAQGGVPIAQGSAPKSSKFVLARNGKAVPVQAAVLAKWPDGSARWVLLDFQADPPASGSAKYRLGWGDAVDSPKPAAPVKATAGAKPTLSSGNVKVTLADGTVRISDRAEVTLIAVDSKGAEYRATAESVKVQTKGDLRSTLEIAGSLTGKRGKRLVGFRMWVSVFAGLSKVLIEPLVLMDAEKGVIQRIRELRLEIKPVGGIASASIGGGKEWKVKPDKGVRLMQVDDQHFAFEGAKGKGSRAPGWAEVEGKKGVVAVALRDFWQQWPKAIEVDSESVNVGLMPRFKAGQFAHMEPSYKFDYLFAGDCYRLRTGQARRWQVWIDLDGNGDTLAKHANAPLVPGADPAQAIATGAWGEIAPAGAKGMAGYDQCIDKLFDGYCHTIDAERDYGAMNWGDWFGERRYNWANLEYDVSRQILLQFARTADPKYLHWGSVAARHISEVDTIHFVNEDLRGYFINDVCKAYTNTSITENYPIRAGMMHAHCVGHVGGFVSVEEVRKLYVSFTLDSMGKPYLCLDPYNVGHVFAQGMAYCYFLTGDPWIRETLDRLGANLAQLVEDRKLPLTGRPCAGRELGWPLLALGAIYELDYDKRYLRAMKTLAEDALAEQDPHCGGWLQALFGGHCDCKTRHHIGEAAFITSIRINGLARYYRFSGDERVPDCIKRGIDNMNEDKWKDERGGWRYTSCPATGMSGQPGVTMMAMANAVGLLNDPEHRRILGKAWDALHERLLQASKSAKGVGRGYGSTVYGTAEAVAVLAAKK